MTFSRLIEVLQEMTRTLPESAELPLTMALKNQVCWYPHYAKGTTDGRAVHDSIPDASLQFGISLLYSLLSRGEGLLSSEIPLEPHIGDFETW
mgnify:CR=1 FL=1